MLIYPLFVGMTELIIILCIVLLIFGGKKIPELMKGVGKGVRRFEEGLNEIDEQVQPSEKKEEEKK